MLAASLATNPHRARRFGPAATHVRQHKEAVQISSLTRNMVELRVTLAVEITREFGSEAPSHAAVVWSRTMGGTPISPFCSQNQVFSPHRKSATLGQEDLPL